MKAYAMILSKFCRLLGKSNPYEISTNDAMSLLNQLTEGRKKQTRKIRYSLTARISTKSHHRLQLSQVQKSTNSVSIRDCIFGMRNLHFG